MSISYPCLSNMNSMKWMCYFRSSAGAIRNRWVWYWKRVNFFIKNIRKELKKGIQFSSMKWHKTCFIDSCIWKLEANIITRTRFCGIQIGLWKALLKSQKDPINSCEHQFVVEPSKCSPPGKIMSSSFSFFLHRFSINEMMKKQNVNSSR